jgi:hypothetical protein
MILAGLASMKEGFNMEVFQNTVRILFRRPFVIVFFAVVTLAFCILDYFLSSVVIGVTAFGSGNIFESAVSFLHLGYNLVTDWSMLLKFILLALGAVLGLALVVGFAFSGCMNIINNALDKKPKFQGEFIFGVRKYFTRVSLVNFIVILAAGVFVLFMLTATVPAMVVTRAVSAGNAGLLPVAVFLDLITLGVLFFSFMYFRIYILFWYPALLNSPRRALTMGKRAADSRFWTVMGRFFAFDIVFILFEVLFLYANFIMAQRDSGSLLNTVAIFTVNWAFKSIFFSLFAGYVFSTYKAVSEE